MYFQKFQIHRITIATAYTLQPAVWMIEVSQDNGREYHALKYFVTHSVECATKFGLDERDIENGLCIIQETNNTSLSDKVGLAKC